MKNYLEFSEQYFDVRYTSHNFNFIYIFFFCGTEQNCKIVNIMSQASNEQAVIIRATSSAVYAADQSCNP